MSCTGEDRIISFLCRGSDHWTWDFEGQCRIKFLENGTGYVNVLAWQRSVGRILIINKLTCRSEFCVFISVEFQWKICQPESPPRRFNATYLSNALLNTCISKHEPAQQVELEIRLLKQEGQPSGPLIGSIYQETMLKNSAFEVRRFFVTLEKGSFWSPSEQRLHKHASWKPKYGYRIRFDNSPYPSPKDWTSVKGGPEVNKYWKIKDFTSGTISE